MSKHHLCDANSTAPAYVVIYADSELTLGPAVPNGRQEDLNFFNVVLKEGHELPPVAKPDQSPELILECILNLRYLILYTKLALVINREGTVKQDYG